MGWLAICPQIALSRHGWWLIRVLLARVVAVLLAVSPDANDPDLVGGDGHALHGLELIFKQLHFYYVQKVDQFSIVSISSIDSNSIAFWNFVYKIETWLKLRCFGGKAGGGFRFPVETNFPFGGKAGPRDDSEGKSSTDRSESILLPSRLDLRFSHSSCRDFSWAARSISRWNRKISVSTFDSCQNKIKIGFR